MNVKIYSRKAMEKLIGEGFPEKTAVISFYDPPKKNISREDYAPVDYTGVTDRLFQIALYDIDYTILDEYTLTYDEYFTEADELAEFIISAEKDGYDIICQCDYGQSRSAGCAAAILQYFYGSGISVFADYRYYPNQMVFNKVLDALLNTKKLHIISGNTVSDDILKLGDAIVNPTNPMMRPGGGVSGAIFRKAGVDDLENYTADKYGISYYNSPGMNEMRVTDVRITPGFALEKDIIFAQGPKLWEYESYDEAFFLLKTTYKNVVEAAQKAGYNSILIPSLGTGEYGFEHDTIAEHVVKLLDELADNYGIEIYLVLYDDETLQIYEEFKEK